MKLSSLARWATALAVGAATLAAVPTPASADPAGTGVVINEIYPNGGSANGVYKQRFFELYNPGSTAVNVNGWSLQGRSAAGTGSFNTKTDLGDKTIAPRGYLLVSGVGATPVTGTKDLPTPDVVGTSINVSAGGGQVALSRSTMLLTGDRTTLLANTNLVDLVGYGTAASFEGTAAAPLGSAANGIARNATHVDTDDNAKDFTAQPASPCNSAGCPTPDPEPDPTPVAATIREIQGTGAASPLDGKIVTTRGVVTAVYETGGLSGGFIQTSGTGGVVDPSTRTTSDGLFVYSSAFAAGVDLGDHVEVTGAVSEFNTLTEVTTSAGRFSVLPAAAPVTPARVTFPLSTGQRENLEGMLLAPQGTYTITDNFSTNQYGEIGLAPGDKPFQTPTNVVAPGAPAAARAAQNAQELITLDDASSMDFLAAANQGTAVPWLTDEQVRTGQQLTFDGPVILDQRNSLWKLQPQQQVLAGGVDPVVFGPSTRKAEPEPVGGDVTIGTFNVLNYFPTTGEAYAAKPGNACTYYTDRASNRITANRCGNPTTGSGNGPRGAATQTSFERQQAKIVKAINTLDADVVSLEEIENSVKFGLDRDSAVSQLVAALNADAGRKKWARTTSPTDLPPLAEQDVIRTAFIYQVANVAPVGAGKVLVGSPAFVNARQPYAHSFKPVGGTTDSTFVVVVNHFKSKGSGEGADADQNDGQGASNDSRKKQATALVAFADQFATAAGTDKVFLTGDFNAYNKEDPIRIVEAAGYVNVPAALTEKETYQFGGAVGSLDHVFASDAVFGDVTGADIWNINSYESVAREYSRFNYNLSPLVDVTSPFRASDHDPELVGVDLPVGAAATLDAQAPKVEFGTEAKVTVTVASDGNAEGGAVTVSGPDSVLGTGTIAGGTATISVGDDLAAGTYPLTVAFAGTTEVAEASTTTNLVVAPAVTTTTADAPGSITVGAAATVDVDVSAKSTTPTGDVTITEGDDVLVPATDLADGSASIDVEDLAVGSHTLTVSYAGDVNHAPSSDQVTVVVVKVVTAVTAEAASTIRYGDTLAVAVVVPGAAGGVTISEDGTTLASGDLGAQGARTLTVDGLRLGNHTLTVLYGGSATAAPSSTTVKIKVIKALADLAASVSPSTYGTGAEVRLTAAPAASGAVFVFDGDAVVGMGSLSAGRATIVLDKTLSVGPHPLNVVYAGNGFVDPDDADLELVVGKATPTLAVSGVTSKIVVKKTQATVTVSVKAPGFVVEGGTVQVLQGSTRLGSGTVRSGTVKVSLRTFTSTGTKTLTAKFSGSPVIDPGQRSFTVKVVTK